MAWHITTLSNMGVYPPSLFPNYCSEQLCREKMPNASQARVAKASKILEGKLYRSAPSLFYYLDKSMLWQRLENIASNEREHIHQLLKLPDDIISTVEFDNISVTSSLTPSVSSGEIVMKASAAEEVEVVVVVGGNANASVDKQSDCPNNNTNQEGVKLESDDAQEGSTVTVDDLEDIRPVFFQLYESVNNKEQ